MEYEQAAEVRPYDRSPTMLIARSDDRFLSYAEAEGTASDYRIHGVIALGEVDMWLEGHVLPHAIVLCLGDDEEDARQLAHLKALPTSLTMIFETAMIDTVYAEFGDSGVTLLCNPGPGELAAALALRPEDGDVVFSDAKGESEAMRYRRLTEEVGRIARALAQLSTMRSGADSAVLGDVTRSFHGEGPNLSHFTQLPEASEVRNVIRRRRLRDRYFGPDLFADPAWDMLLDLYAARLEDTRVSVSSLCIAAAVPPTTALRWIGTLTAQKLFVRRADPEDRRRIYIDLSDEAADAMTAWFNAADA